MTGRSRLPALALATLLFWPASRNTEARAELFLSPGVEGALGYTSNRFAGPDNEGSPYFVLTPSLDLTWFGENAREARLTVQHVRTDYFEDGMEWTRETSGTATLTTALGGATLAASAFAGAYRDGVLKTDDAWWVGVSPSISAAVTPALLGALSISVSRTRYDERQTQEGDAQEDLSGTTRASLTAYPTSALTLWIEASAGRRWSNEDSEEYWGAEVTGGADAVVRKVFRVGLWGSLGYRDYREPPPGMTEDRRDTPVTVGAWSGLRLAPWAEWTASGHWASQESTEAVSDYREWAVQTGLRFVYDWAPGS